MQRGRRDDSMKIKMKPNTAVDLRGESNYENLLAADKSVPYNNEQDNVCKDDDGQSDLYIYYQNAIDCLVHSESVITKLQEQLSFKDEQIASLEKKLIETKLELASTKALQDEQSHAFNRIKRRISSVDDSKSISVDDLFNRCNNDILERCVVLAAAASDTPHPQHKQQQCFPPSAKTCTLPSSSVIYASATSTQKGKDGAQGHRRLRRSRSASDCYQSEVMPWPNQLDDDASPINEDCKGLRNHQDPEPQGGFRRFAQRLSWGISPDNSSLEEINRRVWIHNLDHNNFDTSISSRSTTTGSSFSPKNCSIFKAAAVKDSKIFVISDTNPFNRRPTTADACANAVWSERHLSKKQQHSVTFLDDSLRLANISHFFLGSNKNCNSIIKTTPSANMNNINEAKDPSPQHQRKFASSFCRLEGVLFPALFDDCLVDLWVEEKAVSAGLKTRTSVSDAAIDDD